ncbi:MAG: hypothetical protein AAB562_04510, partial [Patescibacteria group bacterium]
PPQKEAEPKRKAWIVFGGPGHFGEYLLNLEDCDDKNFIPNRVANAVQNELGDEWDVSNRGTRLEIAHKTEHGKQDDERVRGAIKKVLGDKYEF